MHVYSEDIKNKKKILEFILIFVFIIYKETFFYLSFACFIKNSAKYLIGFSGLSLAISAIP